MAAEAQTLSRNSASAPQPRSACPPSLSHGGRLGPPYGGGRAPRVVPVDRPRPARRSSAAPSGGRVAFGAGRQRERHSQPRGGAVGAVDAGSWARGCRRESGRAAPAATSRWRGAPAATSRWRGAPAATSRWRDAPAATSRWRDAPAATSRWRDAHKKGWFFLFIESSPSRGVLFFDF